MSEYRARAATFELDSVDDTVRDYLDVLLRPDRREVCVGGAEAAAAVHRRLVVAEA